jgi:hypothetical protein
MSKIARTRRLVIGGATGLLVVAGLGGVGLAAAEGTSYTDGLALAFSTVSTTGFGPGPQTGWGLAATMIVFAAGATCWFAIVVAAFEIGLRRSGASLGGNGYHSIDDEVWARAGLRPRGGGHG